MSNKQKAILTGYVVLMLLATIFWFSIMVNGMSSGFIGSGKTLVVIGNGQGRLSELKVEIATFIAWLGTLIVFGIPTFILYKIWRDKS